MSDAPKTIWAGKYHGTFWQSTPHHQMTEYTRTDSIPAPDALIRAALEAAAEKLDLRIQQIQPEMTRRAQRLTEGKKPGFQYALHRADLDARISCRDKIRAIANDPEAISRIIQSAKDVKAAEGRG